MNLNQNHQLQNRTPMSSIELNNSSLRARKDVSLTKRKQISNVFIQKAVAECQSLTQKLRHQQKSK